MLSTVVTRPVCVLKSVVQGRVLVYPLFRNMGENGTKGFKNFKVVGSVAAPFTPFRSDGPAGSVIANDVDIVENEDLASFIRKDPKFREPRFWFQLTSVEINPDKIGEYVEYLKNHNFQYAFVNGTLAEGMSMTLDERKKVAEAWMKASKGKLKIIMHVGTTNIKDSQDLAKHASSIGVEAMASLCPSYFKPANEEILVDTMCEIAKAAPELPFFYYCINFVTGIYLNPSKFLLLAKDRIPNLVGLKHSSKELNNAYNCTLVDPSRFQVLMGTDAQFLPYFTFGIDVPVTAPYMGTLFYKLKKAYDSKDRETAREIQIRILELNNIRGKYGGGVEIAKAMFSILSGIDVGPVRLPLTRLTADKYSMLKKDLGAFGPVE